MLIRTKKKNKKKKNMILGEGVPPKKKKNQPIFVTFYWKEKDLWTTLRKPILGQISEENSRKKLKNHSLSSVKDKILRKVQLRH